MDYGPYSVLKSMYWYTQPKSVLVSRRCLNNTSKMINKKYHMWTFKNCSGFIVHESKSVKGYLSNCHSCIKLSDLTAWTHFPHFVFITSLTYSYYIFKYYLQVWSKWSSSLYQTCMLIDAGHEEKWLSH